MNFARTLCLALTAIALGMPAPVAAQGQACVLKGPLTITSKPKGQGRKIHLATGTALEILGRQQSWLQVRVNNQEGYGQYTQVRHICAPHNKPGSDALAELPLEALPLPALAALPDAPAEPPKAASAKPAEAPAPANPPVAAKPAAEAPPAVAAAKPTEPAAKPMVAAAKPVEPAAKPAPAAEPAAPAAPPVAAAPAASLPPMAYYPPPESSTLHVDPATNVSEEATPPRRWGALRVSLWTAAGITLVGGGAVYIYNNTAGFDKAAGKINDFNVRSRAGDPSATPAEYAVLKKDYDNWNTTKWVSLGVTCLGAALAISAGVLTIIGDDPGSGADGDVNAPPADPLHRLTITPFGVAGTF